MNVCGNAVGVLGAADAGCAGGARVNGSGKGGQVTDGTGGVIAGNQVNAPISIPVNVCGNAVAIAGDAVAGCEGGSLVKNGGDTGSGQETSGIFGVGAGNQGNLPISVPVDLCGNTVGSGAASCEGGASVRNGGHRTGRQTTDGAFGVIAGNQANAPISVPVTACGDAAALAGRAWSFCEGGAHARSSSGGDQHTSGTGGVIAGNQGNTPISVPVDACGDAAAVVGASAASCNGQTLVEGSHGSGAQTSGDHGVGSGNQPNAPVQTPADACGNAAAVIGAASGLCEDGPGYGGYHPYSRTTGTTPFAARSALPNPPSADGVLPQNTLAGAESVPALPEAGGLNALPALPAANVRHARSGLPGTDGVLAAKTLPGADGVVAVPEVDGLTRMGGLHQVRGVPAVTGVPGSGLRQGAPVAVSVLDTRALPGGGVARKAIGMQAVDALRGGVPVPVAAERVVPVTGQIGDVRNVAAQEAVPDGAGSGSAWAMAASGMLGVVAGGLALARRVRLGGRR
ncbi:chaplin [Actinomadura latina]|uniref:Chaplin n=1 Tax=Actinomadura latina TaxID=163603 RepID=A0A846YRL2_9ACTN|nr:chaplin [Actinomadura latina]